MLKKQSTTVDEKGYLGEDSRFMSFSQEFNDLIEHKRGINQDVFDQNEEGSNSNKNKNAMEQVR